MFYKVKYHYEVIGWDTPNQEAYHSNCTTKQDALRVAGKMKDKFRYMEVCKVAVDAEDENNYLGDELIESYGQEF